MPLANGIYKITNKGFAALLKPAADSASSGLIISTDDQSDSFRWILKNLGGTVYTLQNVADSLYVSTSTNAQPGGTLDLQTTGFQFNIVNVAGQPSDVFNIYTMDTGVFVAAQSATYNAKVVLSALGTGNLSQWSFAKQ